jgi:CubicO group peptidase (beta-lactamase class C family)
MGLISHERLRETLAEFVARLRAETNVPGIVVGVSLGGARIYARAGTRNVDDTLPLANDDGFCLGGGTHLLLAAAALELHRDGALALDAPLGEYLPELAACVHGTTVRVAHLLSHTAGYCGTRILDPDVRALTWQSFVRYLADAPQLFAPGAVFSYEHTESVLLGEILRRISGRAAVALLREAVLEPLGIRPRTLAMRSGEPGCAGRHELDQVSGRFARVIDASRPSEFWLAAFSDYTLTVVHLLTIAEAVAGVRKAANPISRETQRRLATPQVRLPSSAGGPSSEWLPVAYSLGAAQLRDGFHGSGGATRGQCSGVRFNLRSGVGVAVGLNARLPYLRDFILDAVCRDLCAQPVTRERPAFDLSLAELPGVYEGPGGGFVTASYKPERLTCRIGRHGSQQSITAEIVVDAAGALVLRSVQPTLSLGFFREAQRGDVGLMLCLTAYKRVHS